MRTVSYPAPSDTPQSARFRAAIHQVGVAGRIALLVYAGELALATLPPGRERELGSFGLALAARVAAGDPVDPGLIADALQNEDDEGPLYYQQVTPPGPQAEAWGVVVSAMGYAAWQQAVRLGEQPPAAVDGFRSPDALDFCVDPLVGVPDLDWTALMRATEWVQRHASPASEGWGQPVRLGTLHQESGAA